jgi:hypothetical protein
VWKSYPQEFLLTPCHQQLSEIVALLTRGFSQRLKGNLDGDGSDFI